jgi:hypothetical protein
VKNPASNVAKAKDISPNHFNALSIISIGLPDRVRGGDQPNIYLVTSKAKNKKKVVHRASFCI